MTDTIVFAPVTQRAWILDHWFEAMVQDFPGRVSFLFLYGAPEDEPEDETLEILKRQRVWGGGIEILYDDAPGHQAKRKWNQDRYEHMARLRNRLLDEVTTRKPAYALSCDTDILLPKGAIRQLVDEMGTRWDGIAPLTYMTKEGRNFPNAMNLSNWKRPVIRNQTFQVEACFGCVLMRPPLYSKVRYKSHPQGEDLGWAQNAAEEGMKLALCPTVKAKHVMEKVERIPVDGRIGW